MHCILDIETADWPILCLEKGHANLWPALATLSWRLCTTGANGPEFGPMLSYIIRPKNWTISDGITAKTYLTNEYANKYGIDVGDALRLLKNDLDHSKALVVFEAKKKDILEHAFAQNLMPLERWPALISIQDIFMLSNKQWLVPGILKRPSLKQAWALLSDSEPQDPLESSISVSLLSEMISQKPKWPTEISVKLGNIVK